MASNRLTRDQIINKALDLADSPSLDAHDRPSNPTISASAFCLDWLQEGLDCFYAEFPWQAVLATASGTLAQGATSITFPATYIIDVKHGVVIPSLNRRLIRTSFQKWIDRNTIYTSQGVPEVYATKGNTLMVHPIPDASYAYTLYYYSLPATMSGGTIPDFPTDWVLVKYLHIACQEWIRMVPPGSARSYALGEIGRIRKAGLQGEPEDNEIPLSRTTWKMSPSMVVQPSDWMGDAIV